MHSSEWINLAKKVPCGQSRRHYHGSENRPNLIVFNNPDSWSSYCHSCKTSGIVKKQYMQKVDEVAPPKVQKYLSERDVVTLEHLSEKHTERFKRLVLLLHRKHMSLAVLAPLCPVYSLTDERLIFRFPHLDLGRDCTERSPAKWLHYHNSRYPYGTAQFVYLQGTNAYETREPVILTEDLFSAQKVRFYTGYSTMCILGTRLDDTALKFVLDRYVVCATDGDSAGHKAAQMLKQRCNLFSIPYTKATIPEGLDPKDLTPPQLIDLFKFLE